MGDDRDVEEDDMENEDDDDDEEVCRLSNNDLFARFVETFSFFLLSTDDGDNDNCGSKDTNDSFRGCC